MFREGGWASPGQLFTQRSITPLNCILHQFAISLCLKFHSSILLGLRSGMTGLFLFLVLAGTACETLELELLQCRDGTFSLFSMESGIFSAWQLGVGAR